MAKDSKDVLIYAST